MRTKGSRVMVRRGDKQVWEEEAETEQIRMQECRMQRLKKKVRE